MTEREKYFWDLTGYLIVRDVLSEEEIAEANEALDYAKKDIFQHEEGRGDYTALKGTAARWYESHGLGEEGHGLLTLPAPYCEPFRKMLAHPQVVARLNEMCGPGFRLDHGPQFNNAVKGTEGLSLHGAGDPHNPVVAYRHQNGAGHCNGVTVTWNLTDSPARGGGFVCVPGSHKSKYPMPGGVRTCEDDMGTVVQPEVKAGDVIFFMDGAQTHGTHPWRNDHERKSVLYKYASRTATRGGVADLVAPPESYWDAEVVADMSEEQRVVMWGPFSGGKYNGLHLTCAEDGTVQVER